MLSHSNGSDQLNNILRVGIMSPFTVRVKLVQRVYNCVHLWTPSYGAKMMGELWVIIALSCLMTVVWSLPPYEAMLAVSRSNNKFAVQMYKELSKQKGNVFFSPLSVDLVLAMLEQGARGETSSQIVEGLSLPRCREQVSVGFNCLMTHLLTESGNNTLDIANRIFVNKEHTIKISYQMAVEENFLSGVEEADFGRNPEDARACINHWVEEKTRHKITNVLQQGSVNRDTGIVVVNAIYFKGNWLKQFNKDCTSQKPFHTCHNSCSEVDMMHAKGRFQFNYLPELNLKVLRLQYVDKNLSMLVLLPDDIEGLPELEANLESGIFSKAFVCSLLNGKASIQLPKFKLEKAMLLNPVLKSLGITEMFGDNAAFEDLVTPSDAKVKVSSFIQKSFVEVNDKGCECSAATGDIFMMAEPMPLEPVFRFYADHPFIFLIMDNLSGAILFMGRYVGPN